MKISVVINTYNAELHLEKVLECVKDFDEIVICDMGSSDRTLKIAQKYNCVVLPHEKLSFVEPARNFAIQSAKNDWVLLLDADEIVDVDLKKYLVKTATETPEISCFAIPRKNYFLGKFMRSAYPDYVYRFFKKDSIYWPEFIHSKPEIKGKVVKIPSRNKNLAMEHLANDAIAAILEKNNTYSTAEIDKRKEKKVSYMKMIYSPFFWFIKYFFFKKGFLDGKEGLIFAALKSQYKFNTLAKIIEAKSND